jgi:hypothetical protein
MSPVQEMDEKIQPRRRLAARLAGITALVVAGAMLINAWEKPAIAEWPSVTLRDGTVLRVVGMTQVTRPSSGSTSTSAKSSARAYHVRPDAKPFSSLRKSYANLRGDAPEWLLRRLPSPGVEYNVQRLPELGFPLPDYCVWIAAKPDTVPLHEWTATVDHGARCFPGRLFGGSNFIRTGSGTVTYEWRDSSIYWVAFDKVADEPAVIVLRLSSNDGREEKVELRIKNPHYRGKE